MLIAGNPVAVNPPKIEAVDNIVKLLTTQWVAENPPIKWWQFWKKPGLYKSVQFILDALDSLIIAVEKEIASGPEKKAIVLAACSVIYDFVTNNALPLWAKPWASKIKEFVIYILIATAIDWIIEKYRNGSWAETSNTSKEPIDVQKDPAFKDS